MDVSIMIPSALVLALVIGFIWHMNEREEFKRKLDTMDRQLTDARNARTEVWNELTDRRIQAESAKRAAEKAKESSDAWLKKQGAMRAQIQKLKELGYDSTGKGAFMLKQGKLMQRGSSDSTKLYPVRLKKVLPYLRKEVEIAKLKRDVQLLKTAEMDRVIEEMTVLTKKKVRKKAPKARKKAKARIPLKRK